MKGDVTWLEFTSLVGMRTSHVCALRIQDLYAHMPPGSHLCHTVSSGQHNLRALNTERLLSFIVTASIRLLIPLLSA
jgi:hypothetical protein